jgi:hypothetical protein
LSFETVRQSIPVCINPIKKSSRALIFKEYVMPFVQPNLWILSGGSIHWKYSTTGPTLHYQDAIRSLNFTGSEIRVAEVSDIGTLVSVTTFLTVDTGSSSFTVLLPIVNLASTPGSSAPVSTDGISTAHHFSIVPAFDHGQQESYGVTPLTGTGFRV